jgi:hypothetical protein
MLFSKEFLLLIVVTDLKSENKRQDVLRMNSIIYSLELDFLHFLTVSFHSLFIHVLYNLNLILNFSYSDSF